MLRLKNIIIKRAMKLFGRKPTSKDIIAWSEIFCHDSFTKGTKEERERIMLESSEYRYCYENQHPWDAYFRVDIAPLLEGEIVLDLGCFTGGRAVAWAERYKLDMIYGIDIDQNYIEAAQQFAKQKGIRAQFICAKGESLPFKDDQFDAIFSMHVFEHIQDLGQVLAECNRVLKRQGRLYVVFPSYFNPIEHHLSAVTRTPCLHYFFSGRDLVEVYNEMIDEKGEEASWYKRPNRDLEPWERCNTINGMTKAKFRRLLEATNWNIYYEHNPSLLSVGGIASKYPALKLLGYLITPLAQLRILEEYLSSSIVYILEKGH